MRRHAHELKAVERHERALDRLDTRENRAVATALKRESCRRLGAFPLKPEFNRGVAGDASSTAGDARRLAEQFRQRAWETDFRKGDLQSAFERAKSGSSGSTTDGGNARKKSPTRKPGHDHERDDF